MKIDFTLHNVFNFFTVYIVFYALKSDIQHVSLGKKPSFWGQKRHI